MPNDVILDSLQELDDVKITACSHIFHTACLDE